jgi:hypothetical protein
VCAEASGGDALVAESGASSDDRAVEQRLPQLRRRGRGKARPEAVTRVSRKRELGYQQQPATRIEQAQVHATFGIGKDPVSQQSVDAYNGVGRRIGRFDGQQHQQAWTDLTHDLVVNLDPAEEDSL